MQAEAKSMGIPFEKFHDEYLREPGAAAIYLGVGIEEGDPLWIRYDLISLAESMSRNDPDAHHSLPQRIKDLLPETGGLPLVVLCKAAQMLGLRLRVMTKGEAIAHHDAVSDGKPIPLPGVQVTTDFDEILNRGLSLGQSLVAVAYLTACLEEADEEEIQMAIRGVIECRRNRMDRLAKKMRMQPEAIYEMMTGKGKPTLTDFKQILRGLGFKMTSETAQREPAERKKQASVAA